MGGGRDFSTGQSIYIRRNGVYFRRDGKEIKRKVKEQDNEDFIKTAQDILGHSTPIMTMRYADTEVAQVQRAAAPMGEAFPVVGKPGNSVLELGAM